MASAPALVRDTAASIPRVASFNHLPYSMLILFPYNEIFSDLTCNQSKENAKKKDNDGGKGINCGALDQEKESEKQKLGKALEHVKDVRAKRGSMDSEDQCKVDVHGGRRTTCNRILQWADKYLD